MISVSSSLPLGTPPVPIRALWELFDGCTVWKTRHSVDDLSILDKREHSGWLAWTDPWYLLENNASSPQWRFFQISVKNTSTVNQYQYKYSKPIDFKLVTIWESGIEGLIKKSITIEFQQTYQIFWKILNLEILLAVLYNVNTVPETKRIVNCSNLSKALCTSKEWQSNCGHGVLPSSSSKCLHHLHSALVVKVPAPASVL